MTILIIISFGFRAGLVVGMILYGSALLILKGSNKMT